MMWRTAAGNAPGGLLSLMDAGILTTWVIAADTYRRAIEDMRGSGLIVKTRIVEIIKTKKDGTVTKEIKGGQPIQNPYLPIINKQAQIMIKAAGELGFTPIGRSRLDKMIKEAAPKEPAAEKIGKKAQQNADAVIAQQGTDWADILPSAPLQ